MSDVFFDDLGSIRTHPALDGKCRRLHHGAQGEAGLHLTHTRQAGEVAAVDGVDGGHGSESDRGAVGSYGTAPGDVLRAVQGR